MADPAPTRWYAIRHARCPRCYTGNIFTGFLAMHRRCPICDLRYDREPGYFVGAMYISYAISLPFAAVTTFLIWYFTRWDWWKTICLVMALYAPVIPFVIRYSRVLWLHWDRMVDPD